MGKTDVTRQISAPNSYRVAYPATQFDSFFFMQDGYAISRPIGSRLRTIDELGAGWEKLRQANGFSFALVSLTGQEWDALVVVRIYSMPGNNIKLAVQGLVQAAKQGFQYEKPKIDQHTQSATMNGFDQLTNKQSVSRIYLRKGRVYDVRIAFSNDTPYELKSQLNVVLNSFHLLI